MAGEFEAKIIEVSPHDIAGRLNEQALLARAAGAFSRQGLAERALSPLLDIESLLHETRTLLIATSAVRRREQRNTS